MNDKLKRLMLVKGVTGRELVEMVGMHEASFSRKLLGKRDWSWSEICKICKVLDIENPIGYFDIKRK